MPRVSVLIAAYNPGRYLENTVASVIEQNYTDWELVLVDDGSTEDLTHFASLHPAIRYIRQHNRGLSVARNVGILNSGGEYVAFVDADDIWYPTKLERQVALMDNDPDMAMSHTFYDSIDPEGNIASPGFSSPVESYSELLKYNRICISTLMIRRSCLARVGLFSTKYRAVQDYDMFLKLQRLYPSGFVSSSEGGYRFHPQNMSGNFQLMQSEVFHLLGEHLEIARQENNREALEAVQEGLRHYRKTYASTAFETSRTQFRHKEWHAFFRSYLFAFKLLPAYVLSSTLRFALKR